MTDREKMIEVIRTWEDATQDAPVKYLESLADRLIAAGFRWMVRPYVKLGCGNEFDFGEDCGVYTCGGYVDGEEWLCEECRSKQ